MRRRSVFNYFMGLAVGLGATGCATAPAPRASVPPQYLGWNAPKTGSGTGTGTASTAPDPFAKPPARATVWNYRPGSILLKRFRRPSTTSPPAIPAAEPKDALTRFFPGLYGNPQGDPARVAKARRPEGGEAAPLGRPWLAKSSNTPREDLADADIALLTTGLRVQAYPKSPSPTLPAAEPVAIAREAADDKAPTAPEARLVSNETTASPASSKSPDLIDAIDLSVEDPPAQAAPKETGQADAPVDVASRPTSATGETTAPKAEPPVDADLAIEPMQPTAPTPAAAPEATPVESRRTAQVESTLPRNRSIDPVLEGRPRMSAIAPMKLPEPEFPRTYHGQSLDSVIRQETRPESKVDAPATKPVRKSLVREFLAGRLRPQPARPDAEKTADREVRPSSGTGDTKSGRLESREFPQRWKVFQGVPLQGRDEPSER